MVISREVGLPKYSLGERLKEAGGSPLPLVLPVGGAFSFTPNGACPRRISGAIESTKI